MTFLSKGRAYLLLIAGLTVLSEVEASRRKSHKTALLQDATNGTAEVAGTAKAERDGRFFSLFNVVQFHNTECTSMASLDAHGNRLGTCFSARECAHNGGAVSGNCAAGFGVCCIFILDGTGSLTITQNNTYIQNEGFPNQVTGSSMQTFTVNKVCDDVCFLRLDFERFSLLGTNGSDNEGEGVCVDSFTVMTNTQMLVPEICGENSGQHIYVDIGADPGDTATININTADLPVGRTWDICISQIECSNKNRPRDSCCLQWYTGCTGRLMSFNYANANDNHLNNQQYQICIRQECGFCCVQYQVCPDQMATLPAATAPGFPAGFSFDTSHAAAGAKLDGQCVNDAGARTVTRDHIGIAASGATCSMAGGDCDRAINSRYCGGHFSAQSGGDFNIPICDCTAPFSVDVFFNNNADQAIANTRQSRGFCLEYMQVPC